MTQEGMEPTPSDDQHQRTTRATVLHAPGDHDSEEEPLERGQKP